MSHRIHVTARSSAPPSALFARLADASTWPRWSPIDSASLDRAGDGGAVGEIRRFRTGRTTSVEEVVETVPDRRLSYVLLEGLPLLEYRADVELEPEGVGTRVHWRSRFRARRRGTGWLYRWILKRFLQQMVEGLAREGSARPGPGH